MWETYVEPNLKAQEVLTKPTPSNLDLGLPDDEPMTLERKIAECQAAAIMFGQDPLEAAKAARKSWPIRKGDLEQLNQKLAERECRSQQS